jgi:dihydroneopterin aldolase
MIAMSETEAPVTAGPDFGRRLRRVFVQDLELMASVGIFEIEKRYQQRVLVSLDLDVVDGYDGRSDRLEDVFDYGAVVVAVRAIVDSDHFHLIETLAERIAQSCLSDARVKRVRVAVEKPDIIPGCRSVGIAIERTPHDY